ncbi:DNA-directed DNA polymerase delta [Blyttiomyces sp. JEL0837]|nr:DNA-directed DNA polymerase delta [Blyttiomyces sp. JEL0837]
MLGGNNHNGQDQEEGGFMMDSTPPFSSSSSFLASSQADESQQSSSSQSASQISLLKRQKSSNTATAGASEFEEQLARMHEMSSKVEYEETWKRAPIEMEEVLASDDGIVFQQLDIDDYVGTCLPNSYNLKDMTILRMYGVTENGHSVTCHVHGFLPYLFIPAPNGFTAEHIHGFKYTLNRYLMADCKASSAVIVDVQIVAKQSIYGYQGKQQNVFLQIFVHLASQIAKTRTAFEKGVDIGGNFGVKAFTTFESSLQFPLRFMIDTKIVGANWIQLPKNKFQLRHHQNKISTSQIEVDIQFRDIVSHEADGGHWSRVAPLRILSFDLECAGRRGVFPDAKEDPVIQIANMVTIQGESKPFIRNIFTLKTCANIAGTQTKCYETEREMLAAWRNFVEQVDPDVVIGYNILNFDLPYLIDRAEALKLAEFPFLGRIKGIVTKAKDARFSSKALGTRDNKAVNMEGRLQVDLLQVMQRDHKLRSYTLNSVSAHFLGEQKEDVHHSIITDLQNGNDETRRRLAIYCLKDAYLPQRLLDKLMIMINYIEMARVTGVPFNYLLTRGQQIKVISQLYRKAKEENLLIPNMNPEGTDEQYEGAIVIEPEKGFYEVPIATLDFTSLYPSIMMAHNLCYSTYIANPAVITKYELAKEDYEITPNNDMFVKPDVRKGLLPTILEDLIGTRKRAKADLKKETDPFRRAVLDGRQLALKISANSVYGFTGATIGKLPLLAISSSVTAFGRVMIEKTKELVEAKFLVKNGYEHDAKVIYGDTDSVMVKFGVKTVEEAMKLGREAATYVTGHFIKPINLDFEKVYYPYLLINKKRYAGLYWTNPNKYDKMDCKGIETVRRDSCRMVSVVIDTCLQKILVERDVKGAEEYVKRVISDLLQNKIDLSQLVISKALGKAEYAGKQAHSELAERMRKRDAGSAPALGDRVSYVIVKGTKDAAAYEKAEDPIYVLENNLPIDTKYYLENQLSNPLMRIFEPILGEKSASLLSGDHVRTIQVAAPTTGGLMKFTVRSATCLGCRVPLPKNDNGAVCVNCKPRINELHLKHLYNLNELEVKFSRLWTQCQRCQGSLHQDVICGAQDCPIFYMRRKAQKDVTEAANTMKR